MSRLLLVRHAEPAASFAEHPDPGLTTVGRSQAEAVARRLGVDPVLRVVSSPLARAQETAAPFARAQRAAVVVDEAVGEVPTPLGVGPARAAWLRQLLGGRWADADPGPQRWRTRLLGALREMRDDTVVFTHFVAINVAVGDATGDEPVWCCSPGHCSVTELEVREGALVLVSLGDERETRVS